MGGTKKRVSMIVLHYILFLGSMHSDGVWVVRTGGMINMRGVYYYISSTMSLSTTAIELRYS